MSQERSGSPTPDFVRAKKTARLRAGFWSLLIAVAALDIWRMGSYVNPDGVSYLDIADAYRRGDWKNAINAYWSPMYSWILAGWLNLFKPSAIFESRVVHALGFFILLASLAAFEFLLAQLLILRERRNGRAPDLVPVVPNDAFRLLAYGIFFWAWFFWFRVVVTPDLLMTVFVYLAAGLLLRIRAGEEGWPTFALLGTFLAFAYLAKTAMFLLSFVFLGAAWLAIRKRPKAGLRFLVAVSAFSVVALPWIAALSMTMHRLTFGDAGKISYVVYANGDNIRDAKTRMSPAIRVLDRPALYAIFGKAAGTYPFHYNVPYWGEGFRPRFELEGQLRATYECAKVVAYMFLKEESILFVGASVLLFLYWQGGRGLKDGLALQWVILFPAVSGIFMYSLVHVEPRLIGVFVVLIWLGVYAAFYRPATADGTAIGRAVLWAILLAMGVQIVPETLYEAGSVVRSIARAEPPANRDWMIARSLAEVGVRHGDRVAKIGHASEAYWARLAGVQIVAEVPSDSENESFELVPDSAFLLERDGSFASSAIAGFESTGARAIIARNVPRTVADHGWTRLGRSDLYAYLLPQTKGLHS